MSNEIDRGLPEQAPPQDKKISRRNLITAAGAAVALHGINRIPTMASPQSSQEMSQTDTSANTNLEAESSPAIEVNLVEPGYLYAGPGNIDFETLSSEPLPAGMALTINGKFGDFFQGEASYTNRDGEEVTGVGYIPEVAIGEVSAEVPELTVEEVPWAKPINQSEELTYNNVTADQLTEQIGESYSVNDSEFKLELSLDAPTYADPNQNHGILISNPDSQGDTVNVLAAVRTGEAWSLWQIHVPTQQYTNLTDFKEASPEELNTQIRINKEGTEAQIMYDSIPAETFPLTTPFYGENRYVDLFAASAGNSELIVNNLSLQVPPTGEYQPTK